MTLPVVSAGHWPLTCGSFSGAGFFTLGSNGFAAMPCGPAPGSPGMPADIAGDIAGGRAAAPAVPAAETAGAALAPSPEPAAPALGPAIVGDVVGGSVAGAAPVFFAAALGADAGVISVGDAALPAAAKAGTPAVIGLTPVAMDGVEVSGLQPNMVAKLAKKTPARAVFIRRLLRCASWASCVLP
jgi:hypothetical protein